MRNHNDKRRDMARSVLQSTARRSAKARRNIHHAERSVTRAMLHRALTEGDDGFDDVVDYPYRSRLAEFVEDRRSKDKVAPLIRWASRTIVVDRHLRDAAPAQQLEYFRRALPNNVIGHHAIFHLEMVINPRWGPR